MSGHYSKPRFAKFNIQLLNGQYHVYSPDDEHVAGPFTDRNRALMTRDSRQRDADARSKRGARACMCCGQSFDSDGPHNRLCGTCRVMAHDTQAYSFINPRRRTG
ncbi:MAG: hypothetical protein JXR75_13740 [Rhodobacteraceae bacterium]|nr:hypothetical protein [Paracoccaceae bacterium]